ncbi:MAG: ammonium transporter [Gloeobacteraceae cyanobacterium ES-bin-144]|nr:ammonium transporter [Verrucomicrobiales bacterium]
MKVRAITAAAIAFAAIPFAVPAYGQETAPPPTEAAAAPAATPPDATVEQRIADLESYFGNVGVGGTADAPWNSKIKETPGPGHNGWLMTCAALVLFMTLPGLALFYGGLVRKKNVLSVLAQCLGCAGMVTLIWWAFGYSLVFGKSFVETAPGISSFLGGTEFFFLKGVTSAPNTDYCYWVSQNVFAMYQLMFAIITPALIIGAIAERMKFSAIMLFIFIWMFVIYIPMAHMIWGVSGLMNGVWNGDAKITAIDFAGGTVVHMTSGWSALVLCMILGKRMGFGKEKMSPHSMVLCMVGTGMLWVGWYGFNAGSALAADGVSANAFMTTTLAAATAGFVWAATEKLLKGQASILGMCSGIVAGLVVITPACGFVDATGAVIIGVLAGIIPFIFVMYVKKALGYDDALDTFGVHAIGGTLGAILTGVLATSKVNGNLTSVNTYADSNGLAKSLEAGNGGLIMAQLSAIGITLVISIVGTVIIAFVVKAVIGLRPTPEVETVGLDISEHGEEGYEH